MELVLQRKSNIANLTIKCQKDDDELSAFYSKYIESVLVKELLI